MSEKRFKGTPGPWGVYLNGPHVMIEGDGEIIAGLWNHNVADATLMAASKDLLEALQAIAKDAPTDADFALGGKYDYEGAGNSGDDYDKGAAETHLWAAKIARAAIAKALGDE